MKNFKYKNNIYVLDGDINVKKGIVLYNENNERFECYPDKPGKYEAREVYEVDKGYTTIETFSTEEKANAFVDEILKMVGEENVSESIL